MPEMIRLAVTPPFQLATTVGLLRRRPANQIDGWSNGTYRRVIATGDGPRLLTVGNEGTNDEPVLWLTLTGGQLRPETERGIIAMVRDMIGLDLPPPPLTELIALFPPLEPLTRRLAGFRPPVFPSLFETAVAVLPFQQLSLDAGVAILIRLAAQLGPALTIEGSTIHGMPTPEAVLAASQEDLRRAGLSQSKAATLRTLAELAVSGFLTRAHFAPLPTAEAARELQTIRGIGPWSAGLILLRGLRRMDVFPPGDVGAAKSLAHLLALPTPITPAEAVTIAAAAGPLQGYLYFLGLGHWLVEHGHAGEP